MRLTYVLIGLLLLAACTTENTVQDNPIVYRMSGAFTMPDMQVQTLTVTPDKAVFTTATNDGEITNTWEKEITREQYEALVATLEQNDFQQLEDEYDASAPITDVGVAEITYDGKTVAADNAPGLLPNDVGTIMQEMQSWVQRVQTTEISEEEARQIAQDFIEQTPTYAYDGFDLAYEDMVIMESYPPQYRLTYSFQSTHGGYGDREGQMVTQAITPHTIVVTIVNGEVTGAIIDEQWNVMTQEMISDEDPNTPVSSGVTLTYQPAQCEDDIWDIWYGEGNIQYVQAPTEEQLILDYYANKHNIQVMDVHKVQPEGVVVCQACGCPTTHHFTLRVDESNVQTLLDEGWEQ